MAGIITMNTNLKDVLGFIGVFYLGVLLIIEISHDVHKESVYTLGSMYRQKITVSPASNDLVDLCPNLRCNNLRENFFLGICFCDFDFSFVFTKNACFLCALCSNITTFCSLALNKTIQNYLWKRQICTKFY